MSAGHDAVVLAAGGSIRLGRAKQLLTREGEPLLRRATRLALATAPSRLLVVLGADAGPMRAALEGIPCDIVDHPGWRNGLGSSLRSAAARIGAPHVLVLGCDQPALHAGHLRALLDGASDAPSGCAATRHAGVAGVPAVVPAAWFRASDQLAGDRGFGARLRALEAGALFVLDAAELELDIDAPADIAEAVARGWLDSPAAPAAHVHAGHGR
jgi:molybdenum cofactor cytidylyltransferase